MIKRQRVYRRPDPTLATGVFREFKPRVSCAHEWVPCLGGYACTRCEATCVRGPDGRIVEYSTKAERELEEQERADREYAIAHPEAVVA